MSNSHIPQPSDPPEEVVAAARAWAERIAKRDLTASERVSFEEWLRDAEHEREFFAEYEIRFRLSKLREREASLSEAARPTPPRYLPERRRWTGSRVTAAGAAAFVLLLAIGALWRGLFRQHYGTGIGERLSTNLSDGTRVELNAQTDLEWVGTNRCDRRVRLVRGEALFNVESDPRCPFKVMVGRGSIEVVGTEFDVHEAGNGEDRVSVLEGRVRLHSPTGVPPWQLDLGAGQQAVWSSGPPSTRKLDDPSKTTAWREDRLDFADEPLGQVVEELQRYTSIPIRIADDSRLQKIHVTGELRVDPPHIRASVLRLGKRPEIDVKENGTSLLISYREENAPQQRRP